MRKTSKSERKHTHAKPSPCIPKPPGHRALCAQPQRTAASGQSGVQPAGVAQRKSQGGRIVLRIEDLDAERCPRVYADLLEQDLAWLGLKIGRAHV